MTGSPDTPIRGLSTARPALSKGVGARTGQRAAGRPLAHLKQPCGDKETARTGAAIHSRKPALTTWTAESRKIRADNSWPFICTGLYHPSATNRQSVCAIDDLLRDDAHFLTNL